MELLTKTWKAKENFADNHGHNILNPFDVWINFPFTQVKRSVIISNEHGIYELPHGLTNYVRLKILGN